MPEGASWRRLCTDMVVEVYIWMPDDSGRVGHASLKLSNGCYISCWPPEDKMDKKKCGKKVTGKCANSRMSLGESLEDDIEAEGGRPTHTFRFERGLDEDKMESYWSDWSGRGHYELLSSNCCVVVYRALQNGGCPRSCTIIWRPETLRRYVTRVLADCGWFGTFFNLPGFD